MKILIVFLLTTLLFVACSSEPPQVGQNVTTISGTEDTSIKEAATSGLVLSVTAAPISPASPLLSTPAHTALPAIPADISLLPASTPPITPTPLPPSVGEKGSPVDKPKGKLSFRLQLLTDPAISQQDVETQARALSLPASGPGSLLRNERGELLVYIRLTDKSEANLEALTKAGVSIIHIAKEYQTITAYVSTTQLSTVANLASVESIQEVLSP